MNNFKVAIHTVGCRANQADSSVLAMHLDETIIEIVTNFQLANLVVINTCCVTAQAERDCRKTARKALRLNNLVKVVFTGCAVSAFKDFAKNISIDSDPNSNSNSNSGFNLRVENKGGGDADFKELAKWINDIAASFVNDDKVKNDKVDNFAEENNCHVNNGAEIRNVLGRTRALLKIQNGCNHHCSYCIVPKARGSEKSMDPVEVFENVARIKENGFKELVLTGVQIGAYGKDLSNKPRLADLLSDIADKFSPGRIRLSSIEPWAVNEALLDVIANKKRICSHLHVPLQSGDDGILKTMGRGYSSANFISIIDRAKTMISNLAFGTDVLCGFPGETDEAFNNTMNVLKVVEPAYLHAFSYSKRPGTKAAQMCEFSDRSVSKERSGLVRKYGEQLTAKYINSQLGKTCEVIVEENDDTQSHIYTRGLTESFISVETSGTPGQLVLCHLEKNKNGSGLLALPQRA